MRYVTLFRLRKSTCRLMNTDTFFQTEHFYQLSLEILVALIHPNILTDEIYFTTEKYWYLLKLTYEVNDYLAVFMVIRIFTVLRSLVISTDYYTIRASRVCKMFGSDLTTKFAFRCYYKEHPFRFLFIYAMIVSSLTSYVMRIIEGPVYYVDEQSRLLYNDFRSYENCLWNTYVTMLTGNLFY